MVNFFLIVATGGLIAFLLPCVTPFGALAAWAVMRRGARFGLMVVTGAWGLNEAVGFTVFHYPQTGDSYAWALLSLSAAVVATYLASGVAHATRERSTAWRTMAVLVVGVVGFELALAVGALTSGRAMGGFSLDIDALVVETNVLFFIGIELTVLAIRTIGARFGAKQG